MKKITIQGLQFRPLIKANAIKKRVAELAAQLNTDLAGKDPLFVCMLNGAAIFASDLMRAMDTPADLAFVKWTSYSGTECTGELTEMIPLDRDVKGRDVVVIEDIIDTGTTMYHFKKSIMAAGAASCKIVCLLTKPDCLKQDVKADYVGFEVGKEFVVGNGFDVDGYGRGLKDIYHLSVK